MRRGHRELQAWQCAVELVEMIYRLTESFPAREQFGLTSQMRRAAVSVPANIAEGAARSGTRELLHFLSVASASLSELDTHVEIARRLNFLETSTTLRKIDRVSALLLALMKSLKSKHE